MSNSVWCYGLQPARLLCSWDSGQEYWSGLPCPPPRDLPNPGIEPASLKSPALAGGFLPEVLSSLFLVADLVINVENKCFWIPIFKFWFYPSLLLLSHFSCVRLCASPQTAAHQAPPSLGFSRQEHWSGWRFPSSMRESEKSKWSRSVVSDS